MEQRATIPQRHQAALDALVAKLKQDRHVLAAVLFGSLARGEAWEKSDIDLVVVVQDGVLRPAREGEVSGYWLVENGVSIWVEVIARSRFKQVLERALPGTIRHATHSQSKLLFSRDESIAGWLERTERIGARDQAYQLLRDVAEVPYLLEKAEKWLRVKHDLSNCFAWLLQAVVDLARIEVLLNGEAPRREVLDRAMAYNPAFFELVYPGFINGSKDAQALQQTLDRLDGYLVERADQIFKPVLDYLADAGGPRTASELDAYFRKKVQGANLFLVYEWLAEKGIVEKAAAPLRLTHKSQVAFEEAAYYYDGGAADANRRQKR